MAINSRFSHEKWWFSIAMLVYQRVYELSKCHCCILLIGYWLGGYFAWFIRDEFCCNLRRHTWDTYEPTNTMGWDRADRARTTGHDLAMKRNAMLRWLAMTCVLDIADFPCPIQIEIAFLQEGMKGVQLIMQLVQGHWRLKKNMVERLINDLCSSLFNNCREQHLCWSGSPQALLGHFTQCLDTARLSRLGMADGGCHMVFVARRILSVEVQVHQGDEWFLEYAWWHQKMVFELYNIYPLVN